jgi:hypothetical protein
VASVEKKIPPHRKDVFDQARIEQSVKTYYHNHTDGARRAGRPCSCMQRFILHAARAL